jgi:hypothetical protein
MNSTGIGPIELVFPALRIVTSNVQQLLYVVRDGLNPSQCPNIAKFRGSPYIEKSLNYS